MGVVLVLCASLSLFNDSFSLLVWTLYMEWPVVIRFCFRDLSSIVDTPFDDFTVLVVWPLLALNSCLATVLGRLFLCSLLDVLCWSAPLERM